MRLTKKITKKHLVASLFTVSIVLLVLGHVVFMTTPVNAYENVQLPTSNYINVNMDVYQTATKAIDQLLMYLGLIAVIIILYGGFSWMTAAGNETKIKAAKGILSAGIIGLAIIFLSWAIAKFVISMFAAGVEIHH